MGKEKIKEQPAAEGAAGKTPKTKETAATEAPVAAQQAPQVLKKRGAIEKGRVYINASYNNTIITVADGQGNVLAWASAGSLGFAGPKKATPFASSKVVAAITEKLKSNVPHEVEIIVKGIGGGRDSAVRSLINQGFNVISIKDVTAIPHNRPRPRKGRRV